MTFEFECQMRKTIKAYLRRNKERYHFMISASTLIRIIVRHISFDKFTNAPRFGGALLKFSTGSTTCVRNIGTLDTLHSVSYENVIGCLSRIYCDSPKTCQNMIQNQK